MVHFDSPLNRAKRCILDTCLLFGFGLAVLPGGPWEWLLRAFIFVLLIDAIRASLAYRRIVNKLILEAREPVPEAVRE